MSIHPCYADAILSGRKRVEFRKRGLASDVVVVLIYATKPVGALVGTFTLDGADIAEPQRMWQAHGHHGGIDKTAFDAYYAGTKAAVALRVANPRRFAAPLELSRVGASRPPQSFAYLSAEVLDGLA